MARPLAADQAGNELLDFAFGVEADLDDLDPAIPLPLSLVAALDVEGCLVVFSRHREEWELPGGMIEPGESPRDAAAREFVEETGQSADHLEYVGVATFRLAPDQRIEYAALYRTVLTELRPFEPTDEIAQTRWWQDDEDAEDLAALDAYLARLAKMQLLT